MKYLMMIKLSEKYRSEKIPPALNEAMGEFVTEGFTKGWLKETAGLKASEHGYRIRLSKGKLQTMDGPFTESKEVIGGFAIVETATDAEAREVAHRFMELHRLHWPTIEAESEVRPMEEF
jgi:hypothetical protein